MGVKKQQNVSDSRQLATLTFSELSSRLGDTAPRHDLASLRQLYSEQWCQLADIVAGAIDTGDSNSALVIGPRGVGKTTLVNAVLDEVIEACQSGNPACTVRRGEQCVLVRLHGLLHTDDRLAIKQITRQLQLDSAVGARIFHSFSDNLSFLLSALRGSDSSGGKNQLKTVVFVLDEFDLFCEHKNQTLLYNLFDVAQSAQTPVCVLGVSVRLDVVELLEKRVRSRFSHRQLCLYGVQTFNMYRSVALSFLTLSAEQQLQQLSGHAAQWNASVARVMLHHDEVAERLRALFNASRDIRQLKNFLRLVLVDFYLKQTSSTSTDDSDECCQLQAASFTSVARRMTEDPRVNMLCGLSIVELCLVIAMHHLTQLYDEPFNFEMVLREFGKFAAKNSTFSSLSRPVIMKSFENIQVLELICPAESSSSVGRSLKEFQLFHLMVTSQQISEAVKNMDSVPTEVSQWAGSAIL